MEAVGSHGRDPLAWRHAFGRRNPGGSRGLLECRLAARSASIARSAVISRMLRSIAGRDAQGALATTLPQAALSHLVVALGHGAGDHRDRGPDRAGGRP